MKTTKEKMPSVFDSRKVKEIYEEIRAVYLNDNRPWVLGYSGGKDSSCAAQLVYSALMGLPKEKLTKPVYIISSDTLVETPVIVDHITQNLRLISESAKKHGLPIETALVTPEVSDTFWVNLIGKGYPAPSTNFRWCTERMKIKPANRFILDKVAKFGEVIVILGVRMGESTTRDQVLSFHRLPGQLLSKHSTLPNAFVYTPIVEFTVDDVWNYLLQNPSPWGGDNRRLVTLYKNAAAGECPLVVDTTTPSCGQSRFGCWVCTVVTADKSMEAMIDNGEDWMLPMLEFRDLLSSTQTPENKKKYRDFKRRNGHSLINRSNEEELARGPYLFEFRKELLKKLLLIQKEVQKNGPMKSLELITRDEMLQIRRLWMTEQQDWADSVASIHKEVFGKEILESKDDSALFSGDDFKLLDQISKEEGVDPLLVARLLGKEKEKDLLSRRSKIFTDLENIFEEVWESEAEVLKSMKDRKHRKDTLLGLKFATESEVEAL